MTEMAEENIVLEGFLCPICKVDFGLDLKLYLHFQEAHHEDQDLVKSFKDLFGKAKGKILKNDIVRKERRLVEWEPQEIGEVKSHFQYFKECRNKWVEHFVMETNKTVKRLEKLLCNLPQDPNKRKIHEQTIVQWLDGKDVTRCPDCAKSFNITRRQHHCRLCGSIVCRDCSWFLPLSKAYETINETTEHQAGSTSSPGFRLCLHCGQVLENREEIKYRDQKPLVCDYYDKIMECRNKIENDLLIKFNKTYNLLKEGESSYLTEANNIRSNIVKLVETIDALSNRVLKLENNSNSSKVTSKNIKLAMIQYVRSTVLAVPALPSLKEIEEIAQKKREEAEARLHNGHESYNNDDPKSSRSASNHNTSKNEVKLKLEDGWSPVTNSNVNSDNPMVEQMNIIRNYIKQAREAYRFDEVASLEKNLQELNEEYFKMQNNIENTPEH